MPDPTQAQADPLSQGDEALTGEAAVSEQTAAMLGVMGSPLLLPALLTGCFANDEEVVTQEAAPDVAGTDRRKRIDYFKTYLQGSSAVADDQATTVDFHIQRLINDEHDFVVNQIMPAVFLAIADREIQLPDSNDPGFKKYDKSVATPTAGGFGNARAGEYKCAHFVHNVATLSGIEYPSEKQLIGNNQVLRSVHFTDVLFLTDPNRELMNVTSRGTTMPWRQKHLDSMLEYIDVLYRKRASATLSVDEQQATLQQLYDAQTQDGRILVMAWSPTPGNQYGHFMIIKRVRAVFSANQLEVDLNVQAFNDASMDWHSKLEVVEAGASVNRTAYKTIMPTNRDVAIYALKVDADKIAEHYDKDTSLRQIFNQEAWRIILAP